MTNAIVILIEIIGRSS